MGVARIYTPKDFKITEIMGDVVRLVERAALAEA
jgi:(2R)-ethylmalonyl-CoA mutase